MKVLLLLLAIVCLGLSAYGIVLTEEVRDLRADYDQRQSVLNDDAQYRQLNTQFVRALANAAAVTDDAAIRDMLSSEGITFTFDPPPAPATAPAEGTAVAADAQAGEGDKSDE